MVHFINKILQFNNKIKTILKKYNVNWCSIQLLFIIFWYINNKMETEEWNVGSYADYLYEESNTWEVVKISEKNLNQDELLLEIDGLKFYISCNITSPKLAPFRSKTVGYTGPEDRAVRSWSYSYDEVQKCEAYLIQLKNDSLSTGNAYKTRQFLRGELFTIVDNLLTYDYKNSEYKKVAAFFYTVTSYIADWLKKSDEMFPIYYESLLNPSAFWDNDICALVMAWPELLLTLKRIFGMDPRTSKFHKLYDIKLKDKTKWLSTYFTKKTDNKTRSFFIDSFWKMEGFQLIINILNKKE